MRCSNEIEMEQRQLETQRSQIRMGRGSHTTINGGIASPSDLRLSISPVKFKHSFRPNSLKIVEFSTDATK